MAKNIERERKISMSLSMPAVVVQWFRKRASDTRRYIYI
jgi:hypothetical protein